MIFGMAITNITRIQMIRKCAPKNWMSSSRTECSGLKRSLGNFQFNEKEMMIA